MLSLLRMSRRRFPLALVVLLASLLAPLAAQEKINADINAKIRQEENSHSQIMRTLHVLTDVYAPRVTGSPSLKAAGEWAIKQMESWGFTNGHLEPWDFGHPGWTNEFLSVHIVAPVKSPLVVQALAWTAGTNGPVRATTVNLILPERPLMPAAGRGQGATPQHYGPTKEQLASYPTA